MHARPLARAVQPVGHRLVEDLVDEGRLARPRHAGYARQHAERHAHVDVLEVVLGGVADLQLAGGRPAPARHRDGRGARQEAARQRLRHPLDVRGGALGHDPTAVLAGARPEVDQMIGGAHRLLVVLDDQDGVADVAQPLERADQLRVVALVQPDRGLVEDVQHADQGRADLRGQPDPLRLAARQGRRRAVHRQVADPDVLEELEPLGDLAQDQAGDVALGG